MKGTTNNKGIRVFCVNPLGKHEEERKEDLRQYQGIAAVKFTVKRPVLRAYFFSTHALPPNKVFGGVRANRIGGAIKGKRKKLKVFGCAINNDIRLELDRKCSGSGLTGYNNCSTGAGCSSPKLSPRQVRYYK